MLKGDRGGNVPEGVDWVFDCAAYGNKFGQANLFDLIWANVERVHEIITQSSERKVKALVLISSSSVTLPVQTPYSATKVIMEHMMGGATCPTITLRPYTLYGPGDRDHLIPKLFDSCINGTHLKLDPEPVHDYVYIDDFVDYMIYFAKIADKHKGQIVEVGSGIPVPNSKLVEMIELITDKKANYDIDFNQRPYDNRDWYYKGQAIKLKVDLSEGLMRTYADIKSRSSKAYN